MPPWTASLDSQDSPDILLGDNVQRSQFHVDVVGKERDTSLLLLRMSRSLRQVRFCHPPEHEHPFGVRCITDRPLQNYQSKLQNYQVNYQFLADVFLHVKIYQGNDVAKTDE